MSSEAWLVIYRCLEPILIELIVHSEKPANHELDQEVHMIQQYLCRFLIQPEYEGVIYMSQLYYWCLMVTFLKPFS